MKKLLPILLLLLIGCRTIPQPVPVEPVVADNSHNEVHKEVVHDSVYIKVKEYIKGDIQYRDSIVYKWRYKALTDTIRDSIPVFVDRPVPYDREVPKPYVPKILYLLYSCLSLHPLLLLT